MPYLQVHAVVSASWYGNQNKILLNVTIHTHFSV